MKKAEIYISFILLSLAFVILLVTLYPYRRDTASLPPPINKIPSITPTPSPSPVVILSPNLFSPLKSPQKIIGLIERSWVFEATFPVELFDNQNRSLFQGNASAPNWLSDQEKYTDFSATLKFSTKSKNGYLKIQNDNPSGIPQNNKSIIIPVIFSLK